MRLFLAINIPSAARRAIVDATGGLRDAASNIGWVTEERLHLTLKFLGEQPAEAVDALRDDVARGVLAHRPLSITLGGLGAFPNLRMPRVVWMGVANDPKLELLYHDVERACVALGYEVEGRPFRPHLTLGRAREPLSHATARALARAARSIDYQGQVEVATVDLMLSEPGSKGPRYTLLAAMPLAGA